MRESVGIFGGTFDPPHLGHLILAGEAFDQLALKRLLWVLTPTPPHKLDQTITPLEHRLAMTQLMLADYPQFEISRAEMDRPGPHYMVETIQLLKSTLPDADFVLLIGGDSLRDLPTWYHPVDLVLMVKSLGVMHRPDDKIDLKTLEKNIPGISKKLQYVNAPRLEIASRDIRRRISEGRSFSYYLLPPVFDYIQKNNLYR
jgi:nicotinate-nucleotide adenylyltransferase